MKFTGKIFAQHLEIRHKSYLYLYMKLFKTKKYYFFQLLDDNLEEKLLNNFKKSSFFLNHR